MRDVLLAFGEGGHAEQMERLCQHLALQRSRCVCLVDRSGVSRDLGMVEYVAPPLRLKERSSLMVAMRGVIAGIIQTISILRANHIRTFISTGPGVVILPALLLRMLGKEIVHIETWSRFESKSITGRIMYHVATRFYYQNSSLSKVYPKAEYSGRL